MRPWVLGIALLLAPAVSAQEPAPAPTPTTLFLHVISVMDMPINTQEPDADYAEDVSWGPQTTTLRCLHPLTGDAAGTGQGTGGVTSQAFNTMYGYASPNLVEYAYVARDGIPRPQAERGLASDVRVDRDLPVTLTWYLSLQGDSPMVATTPGAMPNLVVRATVREGDRISIDDEAYNSGGLLMQGQSPPVTLVGDQVIAAPGGSAEGVTAVGMLDGMWVYEVRIPLAISESTIRRSEGFNVRVDVFMEAPVCDPDTGSVQPSFATHTSPGHRPRLDFAVIQPFVVEYADPQFVGEDVLLHFGVNSAWGPYDLDLAGLELELGGPGEVRPGFVLQPQPPRYHDHGHSYAFEPLQLTYVWDGGKAELAPGHYEATIRIPNLQKTAVLEAAIAFDVASADEAPGLAPPLLLSALAFAVLLRRR